MIVGLGVDVCSIERMRRAIERHGERFAGRICTARERGEIGGRDAATFLAGRFAAKEAFAKTLDGARGLGFHDVEVLRAPSGRPVLALGDKAASSVRHAGADVWHVTITHDAGVAVAVVILEAAEARR